MNLAGAGIADARWTAARKRVLREQAVEPLERALADARAWLLERGANSERIRVIYLSPQGTKLDHKGVSVLLQYDDLVLIAGRYEGIDERFIETSVDEEWSIGDYVLSGGELPAMVLIDALTRQQPGVLGDADSAQQDSFAQGLLDCPHYTRPEVYDGERVPDVLMSGNHAHIKRWRLKQSLGRTREKRPDLLAARPLSKEESRLLAELEQEQDSHN